jgi:tetratricopeptide (TPR) repeat protein
MTAVLPSPNPEQRRTAAAQFDRAHQLLTKGQPEAAIRLLVRCCRVDPANLIYRQALRHAQRARLGHRANSSRFAGLMTWLPRRRLRGAHAAGDTLRVLEIAEEVLYLDPWNAEAQSVMADTLHAAGASDVATWCLEGAHAAEPKNPVFREKLAHWYEQCGNFTLARQLRAAADVSTPSAEVVVSLREQIACKSGQPQPYLELAEVYRRAGRLDLARAVLQEGLRATRQAFDIGLALAQLDIESFRQDLAIGEQKLAEDPANAALQAVRSRLLQEINTREIGLYQHRVDRFPGEMGHRFELGIRLLKGGQFDEALAAFEAVKADERYRWRALAYAGYCQLNRNQWPLAKRLFEEALPLVPSSETATRQALLSLLASGGQ